MDVACEIFRGGALSINTSERGGENIIMAIMSYHSLKLTSCVIIGGLGLTKGVMRCRCHNPLFSLCPYTIKNDCGIEEKEVTRDSSDKF